MSQTLSRTMNLVVDFATIDERRLDLVGGKAANLAVLTRAGFPVPSGVCVTTDAYREVTQSPAFRSLVERIAMTSATDIAALSGLAAEARAVILATPIPYEVAEAVAVAYSELGDDAPVAVRSSATAEDLPFASFAGQQDTYLNVVGTGAVLDAVRRCWASLWTDRAVAYRSTNNIDHRAVRLAVVIQRMVQAQVAGVLFTANSVTGKRRQAVIDASSGLGEAVVSGAVNPDRFVVDTATGSILERRIGDKRLVIRSLPGGGTEHVHLEGGAEACISDDQIHALAALGDRVELHYGAPQDTEWAIDANGALWLTQARPITTLFPLPSTVRKGSDEFRVYFCFTVAQGLYRPITPMGLAAMRCLASSASETLGFPVENKLEGPMRYAEAGQRLFVDLTGVLRSRGGRTLLPRILDIMEARSAELLRQLSEDPRLSLVNKSWRSFARRLAKLAVRYRIPVTAVIAVLSPASAHRRAEQVGEELAERLRVPEDMSFSERLEFVERTLSEECIALVPKIMPAAAVGMGLLGLAGKVLGNEATSDDLQTVMRGLPNNVTTRMDLELWNLALQVRGDQAATELIRDGRAEDLAERFRKGTLPEIAQQGLSSFLGKYGHRAVAEIDLGLPRWADDPRHILGVLANYLRLEDSDRAPDAVFERGAEEARSMVEKLATRASQRSRVRGWIVRFALNRARALMGLRELPKYDVIVALAAVRRQLAIVGAALAGHGRLAHADDVFFLDLVEVRAGLAGRNLHAVVSQRREAYAQELRRKHVPRVLLSDGTEPEALSEAQVASNGALQGIPASAGRITGVARVVVDPVGTILLPGEILIAPSTDPGWTPLFLTAGGLVMEMGGANSHGAVVAREYGIPAVVGLPGATARITTGQRIALDGSLGTVTVL